MLNVCEERKWQENKLSVIFFSKKQFLHFLHPPPRPHPTPISSISYTFCVTWLPPLPSEYLFLVVLHSRTLATRASPPFLPCRGTSSPLAAALSLHYHVTFGAGIVFHSHLSEGGHWAFIQESYMYHTRYRQLTHMINLRLPIPIWGLLLLFHRWGVWDPVHNENADAFSLISHYCLVSFLHPRIQLGALSRHLIRIYRGGSSQQQIAFCHTCWWIGSPLSLEYMNSVVFWFYSGLNAVLWVSTGLSLCCLLCFHGLMRLKGLTVVTSVTSMLLASPVAVYLSHIYNKITNLSVFWVSTFLLAGCLSLS